MSTATIGLAGPVYMSRRRRTVPLNALAHQRIRMVNCLTKYTNAEAELNWREDEDTARFDESYIGLTVRPSDRVSGEDE